MTTPDIVLLIVVLLSALMGLFRGLLKEVLSLVAWFAAFILAMYFAPTLAEAWSEQLGSGNVGLVIAFIVVFVLTLVVGGLVQWAVSRLVESTGLSGTDRFLGFLFGSARGFIVCIVALIALRPFVEDAGWWTSSALIPELMAFENEVLELMGRAREALPTVDVGLGSLPKS